MCILFVSHTFERLEVIQFRAFIQDKLDHLDFELNASTVFPHSQRDCFLFGGFRLLQRERTSFCRSKVVARVFIDADFQRII